VASHPRRAAPWNRLVRRRSVITMTERLVWTTTPNPVGRPFGPARGAMPPKKPMRLGSHHRQVSGPAARSVVFGHLAPPSPSCPAGAGAAPGAWPAWTKHRPSCGGRLNYTPRVKKRPQPAILRKTCVGLLRGHAQPREVLYGSYRLILSYST